MKRFLKMLPCTVMIFLFSCDKNDDELGAGSTGGGSTACTKTTTTSSRSINFFDTKSGSPYYNQVVANFKFSQASNTYAGSNSCPLIDCATNLQIQNATAKKMIFDYNIVFKLNLINWNYQGVATIPAGTALDVGQINSNCGSISLGAFTIQSVNITYQ